MSSILVFAFYALCITGLVNIAQAQNQTQAATDPNEGAPLSLSLSPSLKMLLLLLKSIVLYLKVWKNSTECAMYVLKEIKRI
jgi:hypothetical protein